MQPFKRQKRNSSFSVVILKVLLIATSVVILFLIVRLFTKNTSIPSLHADTIRQEFSSKNALIGRINDLQNRIDSYQESQVEINLIKKENEQLKAELGRVAPTTGILARVLTAPNRNFYDTIIIDAGIAEGVKEGHIAYAFESIALGTVTNVQEHRATIQLFSAPGRETVGTAEGSEVSLTLIGRGTGEYEVRMPRDVDFTIGELISYQSVHVAVLARIEKILTDPRDPFQRLLAKAPVNLTALKFVVIR